MFSAILDNPIFQDDEKAREWFEARLWPRRPVCPHCGSTGEGESPKAGITKLEGKRHRPGLYQCNACREQFTVTVGTLMERSKIPLRIWLRAMYLLAASKKGMSTHQLHRMFGVSLKSTWFLMHRIREAMRELHMEPMPSESGPVQADETFVGARKPRKADWYRRGVQVKEPVVSLVQDGMVRSFHIAQVNSATLKPILVQQIHAGARLYTDDATYYGWASTQFGGGHYTCNHSIEEYVRGGATVNACENYFSILKRGIYGVYHHVSPSHLKRYVGEFDLRYNTRGLTDMERTEKVARGMAGKRLTLRWPTGATEGEALHGKSN